MKSYQSLVEQYAEQEESATIEIGIRPSGRIHLGNMSTLALAGLFVKEVGSHKSNLHVTLCDYEMPDRTDWSIKENGFVKYPHQLESPDNEGSILDFGKRHLDDFLNHLTDYLGINANVELLSDIQARPDFREAVKKVLDIPGMVQKIEPRAAENNAFVFPLCPTCEVGPRLTTYDGQNLYAECKNTQCPQGEYDIDLLDIDSPISIHYLIDPLRDKATSPNVAVHVFGGDYRDQHYNGNQSKLDKILEVMVAATGTKPDILVGPAIYSSSGDKMSKSQSNGLTSEKLHAKFGDDYVEAITDFMKSVTSKRMLHVDYAIVAETLL